jgi:hypothetical protein
MAKFTAEITNKDLIDGELVLQIRYIGDDGTIIQDSARTRGAQDDNWATEIIARKIESLEKLPEFIDKITLGEVNIVKEIPTTPTKTSKEKWLEDYNTYSRIFDLFRKGIIEEDNTKFVAAKQKVKDNFNFEYLDII